MSDVVLLIPSELATTDRRYSFEIAPRKGKCINYMAVVAGVSYRKPRSRQKFLL